MLTTGVGGGFAAGIFLLFINKIVSAPVREALAQEIEDPDQRASLVRRVPIRRKLLFGVTGVSIVADPLAVLLFQAEATDSLEEFAIGWQRDVLDTLAARLETAGPDEAVGAAIAEVEALAGSIEIRSFDLALGGADAGVLEAHVLADLRRELR